MDSLIFWDNVVLLLSGILIIFCFVLFFSVRALISYSQEERTRQALRQPQRNFGIEHRDSNLAEDGVERDYEDEPTSSRGDDDADSHEAWDERDYQPPVRKFGAAPKIREKKQFVLPEKSVWFVLGIIFGAGSIALWFNLSTIDNPTTPAVNSSIGQAPNPPVKGQASILLDNGQTPSPPANGPASSPSVNAIENQTATSLEPVAGESAIAPTVGEDQPSISDGAAAFAASLKQNLPMPVQPGVTITAVTAEGAVVLLVFNIAKSIADGDSERLEVNMKQNFRQGVCETEPFPDNIHGLSNLGVTFLVNYYDLLGRNVARFSAEPKFCSDPT